MALRTAAGERSRTNALYGTARRLPLAVISLVAFVVIEREYLVAIAASMILVQSLDAIVGYVQRDQLKTVGPAVTALFNRFARIWLL